jgi:hypothetical protein
VRTLAHSHEGRVVAQPPHFLQRQLIWEEVSHSYTEAAVEGDVVVGKRKSLKGEYIKRTLHHYYHLRHAPSS